MSSPLTTRPVGTSPTSAQQRLVAGGGSLDGLRLAANKDPKSAIKEVAKQFEGLFMQELMKSMRATTMAENATDNNAGNMATGMLDQQYAGQMSGQKGGLADAIARQLERQMTGGRLEAGAPGNGAPLDTKGLARPLASAVNGAQLASRYGVATATAPQATASVTSQGGVGSGGTGITAAASAATTVATSAAASATGHAQDFVQAHAAAAEAVSAESGIPARFMLAQAAHETGWGRREIRGSDGSNSNNLFGIKAGANWTGPTVTATTTEVVNGQPQRVQAQFRAYASAEDSFRDYAQLIGNSPRYQAALAAGQSGNATAFAQGLQRAGYATDPAYAAKLGRVIDTTARLQRQVQANTAQADDARSAT
ncbi:MAG: flagellar assembly peptidoglycan hydrolase FlgJ [Leptothrix sp. (in: b-proteobacteria)]